MADLSITAANVVAATTASVENGKAGASITAGQVVYREAVSGTYKLADSNSATVEAKTARGIALHAAAANQPLAIATKGDITIGATLSAGASYYLSETPGGIEPSADLTTGENVCQLGFAKSTTVLALNIQTPGVTL